MTCFISFRLNVIISLAFALLLLVVSANVKAVDLRGRVQVQVPYNPGWVPRPYANVALFVPTPIGPRQVAAFTTGSDGMYYFYRIPPGPYRVVVNNITFLDVFVPHNSPTFDVVPIWLPN